ncbi:MAG: hypothetical protein CMJ86_07180 [Planctomycetes bacterium]|nr:hypothetical protein [Planctomycetota bacterium]
MGLARRARAILAATQQYCARSFFGTRRWAGSRAISSSERKSWCTRSPNGADPSPTPPPSFASLAPPSAAPPSPGAAPPLAPSPASSSSLFSPAAAPPSAASACAMGQTSACLRCCLRPRVPLNNALQSGHRTSDISSASSSLTSRP